MDSFARLAVLGAGNMGSSIIKGLIAQRYPSEKLIAADINEKSLINLQQAVAIDTTTDMQQAAHQADIILLVVKPQHLQKLCETIHTACQDKLVISVAAGVTTASIAGWLKVPAAIIRAMPNTPALIGAGATAIYATASATSHQIAQAKSIMEAVGMVVEVNDENLIDAVTAVSGSGPAYFFQMMYSMQQAGQALGLDEAIAKQLTVQTALGAALLAQQSTDSLLTLQKQVTSPGGTTESALTVLENNNLPQLYAEALQAAYKRSKQIAKEMGA